MKVVPHEGYTQLGLKIVIAEVGDRPEEICAAMKQHAVQILDAGRDCFLQRGPEGKPRYFAVENFERRGPCLREFTPSWAMGMIPHAA